MPPAMAEVDGRRGEVQPEVVAATTEDAVRRLDDQPAHRDATERADERRQHRVDGALEREDARCRSRRLSPTARAMPSSRRRSSASITKRLTRSRTPASTLNTPTPVNSCPIWWPDSVGVAEQVLLDGEHLDVRLPRQATVDLGHDLIGVAGAVEHAALVRHQQHDRRRRGGGDVGLRGHRGDGALGDEGVERTGEADLRARSCGPRAPGSGRRRATRSTSPRGRAASRPAPG